MSAFSEFATKNEANRKLVFEAVDDIVKSIHHREPVLAWIEPATGKAVGFIPKLFESIGSLFGRGPSEELGGIAVGFKWWHPFARIAIDGHAQVLPIDRLRAEQ